MIQFHLHQSLFVSTFIVLSFLPFLWSVKPDTKSNGQSTVQGFTINPDYLTKIPTTVSSSFSLVNSSNSVQSESIILNTTTIITNSVPSESSTVNQLDSMNNNSTFDPSLSPATNNHYSNITLINFSKSPVTTTITTTINSTVISSESHKSNNQQQLPTETSSSPSSQLFPSLPPSLEFITLSAFGLLVSISFLVVGVNGCVKFYHNRYPFRFNFGRKFSTFENPIYVQKMSSSYEIDTSRENQAGPTVIEPI